MLNRRSSSEKPANVLKLLHSEYGFIFSNYFRLLPLCTPYQHPKCNFSTKTVYEFLPYLVLYKVNSKSIAISQSKKGEDVPLN